MEVVLLVGTKIIKFIKIIIIIINPVLKVDGNGALGTLAVSAELAGRSILSKSGDIIINNHHYHQDHSYHQSLVSSISSVLKREEHT